MDFVSHKPQHLSLGVFLFISSVHFLNYMKQETRQKFSIKSETESLCSLRPERILSISEMVFEANSLISQTPETLDRIFGLHLEFFFSFFLCQGISNSSYCKEDITMEIILLNAECLKIDLHKFPKPFQ